MGTGTSSGRSAARSATATSGQSFPFGAKTLAGAINKAQYKDMGNGHWELDVPGYGGVSILDETGSSKDPYYGRGGKVYGILVYDEDGNAMMGRGTDGSGWYITQQKPFGLGKNRLKTHLKA